MYLDAERLENVAWHFSNSTPIVRRAIDYHEDTSSLALRKIVCPHEVKCIELYRAWNTNHCQPAIVVSLVIGRFGERISHQYWFTILKNYFDHLAFLTDLAVSKRKS